METARRKVVPKQLIDGERHFSRQALAQTVETLRNNSTDIGKDYFNISIIGVQGSGKSTLLNHLFSTEFQVLNSAQKVRTTRGVIVSLDSLSNLLVFDVQGNDSQENSQDLEYEKMVCTFAFTIAHVLIINVSSQTVGQYTGSQYDTLRTIMDVCMGQFKQEAPKTILFCVRDFNQEYDEEGEIRRKIVKDVNSIWLKMEKPEHLKKYEQAPERVYNLQVAVLRKYRPDNPKDFLADVAKLRYRFTDPKDGGYLLQKQNKDSNLPISDFIQLSQNSWEEIIHNRKLNLPAQKEQLASYRCNAILQQVKLQFQGEIRAHNAEQVDLGALIIKYLSSFATQTYLYGRHLVEGKHSELEKYLVREAQLRVIEASDALIRCFQGSLNRQTDELKQNSDRSYGDQLRLYLDSLVDRLNASFKRMNIQIPDRRERIDSFAQKMQQIISNAVSTKTDSTLKQLWQESSRIIRKLAGEMLRSHFGHELWAKTNETFQERKTDLLSKYADSLKWVRGLVPDAAELDSFEKKLQEQLTEIMKADLSKTLCDRAFEFFQKEFTRDEHGSKLDFQTVEEDRINQMFEQAREQVVVLISNINNVTLRCDARASMIFLEDDANCLFDSAELDNLHQQIHRRMNEEYAKTMRRKKEAAMKRVPWYLLLIIAYFVYDDVWVEEEHFPVLHRVLTFAVCVLLMLFVLGQGNVVKGFACAAFARVATRGEQLKRVWKHKFGKQNT